MSERERLAAQLLCVGFPGDTPDAGAFAELAALGPGGLILFARNVTTPARTRALATAACDAVAAVTGVRPFVGIDQEGGRVARLRDGAAALPPMMALGAVRDEHLARRAGEILARDVRAFGGDVDFAPVLDLALAPASTVVGTRAFSADPAVVAELGAAVVDGLVRGGVAAVVKHAPGHGATAIDSHDGLPVVDASPALLLERDLVPFVAACAAGAAGVMFGHVVYGALDAVRPGSLSPAVVAFVRAALGDAVPFLTDCLEMGAITETTGTAEAAAAAIAAGIDIAIVSHRADRAHAAARAIARDVERGTITAQRFAEALARAAAFRARARQLAAVAPARDAGVELDRVADEVATRALQFVRGDERDVTLAPDTVVTIVSFEAATAASAEGEGLGAGRARTLVATAPSLGLELRRRRVRAESMRVPRDPDAVLLESLLEAIDLQGDRRLIVIARRARLHPGQRAAIAALLARRPDALVIAASEPDDVSAFADARTVVLAYGDGPAECAALAERLTRPPAA